YVEMWRHAMDGVEHNAFLTNGGLMSLGFFFSSRRRHTRSKRDWSSDVCSSDLLYDFVSQGLQRSKCNSRTKKAAGYSAWNRWNRSEERRVGKEWKIRWWE